MVCVYTEEDMGLNEIAEQAEFSDHDEDHPEHDDLKEHEDNVPEMREQSKKMGVWYICLLFLIDTKLLHLL